MREKLVTEIEDLEAEKVKHSEQLEQTEYGTAKYNVVKAELDRVENKLAAKRAELEKFDKEEFNGGLKEMIYQIFDAALPANVGNSALGINEYQEIGETFRKMVDMAIDDNNSAQNEYIAGLLEAKDTEISALNTLSIDLDARLRESIRKEQANEEIIIGLEEDIHALKEYSRTWEARVNALESDKEERIEEFAEMEARLKAKDEQIAKLTEEINKPKPSGIILPNQAKPSATLQQMMDAAKSKSVKSSLELALSGENTRGKVYIKPPSLGGSDNAAETFQVENNKINFADSGVPTPQAPSLDFRDEEGSTSGLVEGESTEDGTMVTREEVEARFKRIEEHLGLKSWRVDEDNAEKEAMA